MVIGMAGTGFDEPDQELVEKLCDVALDISDSPSA
jgi:hypothetical protein